MGRIILIGSVGAGMLAAFAPLAGLTIGAGLLAIGAVRIYSRRNAPAAW